jgi:hypothetical protein
MSGGVGSIPVGLSTNGTVYWADSGVAAGAGVLSIYTTYHCERRKTSSDSSPPMLEWSTPTRRHVAIGSFRLLSAIQRSPSVSRSPNQLFYVSSQQGNNCRVFAPIAYPTIPIVVRHRLNVLLFGFVRCKEIMNCSSLDLLKRIQL